MKKRPPNKGPEYAVRDVYVYDEFEEVKFRWDHLNRKVYCKFCDDNVEFLTNHDNKLYNDAILSGEEITKEQYEKDGTPT